MFPPHAEPRGEEVVLMFVSPLYSEAQYIETEVYQDTHANKEKRQKEMQIRATNAIGECLRRCFLTFGGRTKEDIVRPHSWNTWSGRSVRRSRSQRQQLLLSNTLPPSSQQ